MCGLDFNLLGIWISKANRTLRPSLRALLVPPRLLAFAIAVPGPRLPCVACEHCMVLFRHEYVLAKASLIPGSSSCFWNVVAVLLSNKFIGFLYISLLFPEIEGVRKTQSISSLLIVFIGFPAQSKGLKIRNLDGSTTSRVPKQFCESA